MIKKTFQDWTYEDVEEVFKIELNDTDTFLTEWLTATYSYSDYELKALQELALLLFKRVNSWNEDELKFFFISPLVSMVKYEFDRYKAFTQRPLAAVFEKEGYEATGRVEVMLAKGKLNPKQPYFFIHEYKPEKNRDNDPLGQVLIAMVVARQYNTQKFPIYGCYVNGRNWFFVVLHDETYSVSRAYDATDIIDLQQILASLIDIKRIIEPFL
jgi:hypothetical protein